jgi:hypothetical protein
MEALHLRQTVRFFGVKRSCERRLPVREFDCFRLGTAMTASTNLCLISFGGPRGTPLSQGTFFPETPGFRILARPVRSQPVLIADSSDPSRKTWQSPGLPSHPKNFKSLRSSALRLVLARLDAGPLPSQARPRLHPHHDQAIAQAITRDPVNEVPMRLLTQVVPEKGNDPKRKRTSGER